MRYLLIASLCFGVACGDDDDIAVIDAAVDAAVDAGGVPMCGTIGTACDPTADSCDDGQECLSGIGGDFCANNRRGCGGIAGDTCDDPAAPLCHYLTSATFGPCLSAFERDCICEKSPGSLESC